MATELAQKNPQGTESVQQSAPPEQRTPAPQKGPAPPYDTRDGRSERRDGGSRPLDDASDREESRGASISGARDQGGKLKPGMDPRKRRRFFTVALIVVVLVTVGAVLWWLHARNYESTDDAYIDAHMVHLTPQIAGRVLKVHVKDNEKVHKGQLLIEIDPADAQARLDQFKAQKMQAEAQLAQAEAQIKVSQANYDQAKANAAGAAAQSVSAALDMKRMEQLQAVHSAAVTQQQVDRQRATADNATAQKSATAAQATAAAAQVDIARTQAEAARAAVKTAEAEVEQAEINLGYTRIVAPEDGTIANRTVAIGNAVAPGTEMLAIVPLDIWVSANFKETQLDLIRIGQPVDITVDAYPEINFHGHVDSIQRGAGQAFSVLPAQNATGNFIKVVQRVPVKIVFDDPKDHTYALGPGMSVIPTVHVR